MQQNPHRTLDHERLVQAAHRFAEISRDNPVKLFSLLYMLDIRHFRLTGESCTGEVYYAMADGPAPGALRPLLVMRDMELDAAIGMLTATNTHGPWTFEAQAYGKRAIDIMQELETLYRHAALRDLRLNDANAWWRVYTKTHGVGAVIPYEMTLPGQAAADKAQPQDRKNILLPAFLTANP
ncbi:MAG: hypothetical protein ACKN9T_19710 [Candidatus Methylumidiphilus sp.]